MKTRLYLTLISFVLISTPLAIAETSELKIGAVLALTGDASYHGTAIMRGAQIAQKELEKNGTAVKLTFEDDQTNPTKTVSAIRSLHARGYRMFLGPTWSFQLKAVMPILKSLDAVSVAPAGASHINGGPSEFVFNICPPRIAQTPVVTNWLQTHKHKKALIMTPNGDWGEVHRTVFRNALDEVGIPYNEEQFDFTIGFSSLKTIVHRESRKGIDIIFITGAPRNIADLITARNQLQLDLSTSVFATKDIEEAIALEILSADAVKSRVYGVGLPSAKSFSELYKSSFNEDPPTYADRAYDAIMALAEAYQNTDGTSAAVRNYLRDKTNFKGMSGTISFDKNGDLEERNYGVVNISEKFSNL